MRQQHMFVSMYSAIPHLEAAFCLAGVAWWASEGCSKLGTPLLIGRLLISTRVKRCNCHRITEAPLVCVSDLVIYLFNLVIYLFPESCLRGQGAGLGPCFFAEKWISFMYVTLLL